MQDDSSQDWQQPAEAASGTPFQAVALASDVESEKLSAAPTTDNTALAFSNDDARSQANDEFKSEASQSEAAIDSNTSVDSEPNDEEILVRWQGPEHLYSERSTQWYAALVLVTLILMAIAYFAFRSLTFMILLPVMAVALGVYAHRPPEIIDYVLTRKGLYARDRLMPYDQFKSFDVVTIGNVHHIALIPRKRFQLGQNIYFPEESGEKIVDMLAARLPMKEVKPDFIDKLLAKLHL